MKHQKKKLSQQEQPILQGITTKNKIRIFLKIFFALFIILCVFLPSVKSINSIYSDNFIEADAYFYFTKKKNKEALRVFKNKYSYTPEYIDYKLVNNEYEKAKKLHLIAVENEKWFGFDTFYLFSIDFFPYLGMLLCFLLVIYRILKSSINTSPSDTFKKVFLEYAKKYLFEVIICVCILTYLILEIYWALFIQYDFNDFVYIISALATAYFSCLAVFNIALLKEGLLVKLQKTVNALSVFSFDTAKKHVPNENIDDYDKDLIDSLRKEIE